MQPSDGDPAAGNVHARWRLAVARRAADAYAANPDVAALAAAGSVGAGVADRFSDLELDCYWVRPPADADRLAPVRALGDQLMASWRARADAFPDPLVRALVEQALDPGVLTGWAAREALVSRGDDLAVADLMTRAGHAAVRAVLALNRVYLPHRQLKWQRHLLTGLDLAPERFLDRLALLSAAPPPEAIRAAEALLAEIVTLAGAHSDADLGDFREALAQRRPVIDPPPPAS